MQIICWNIKKNNEKNIKSTLISEAIKKSIDINQPWLLAILENTSGGDKVGQTLRQELNGHWSETVPAGGGRHTKENVVLVGGNCTCKRYGIHTHWQNMFGGKFNLEYFSHVTSAEHKPQEQTRSLRTTSQQASLVTARREVPWDPRNCRNPVLIEVNDGIRDFRFGFVHSPGPQEGVSYSDEKYAQTYFTCIMESLQDYGLDGLMGDFNIYGSEPQRLDNDALQDVSFDLGGTTFKKATGSVGDSRLDRAYLTSKYALHSKIELVNGSIKASDHVGVKVELATCHDGLHALLQAVQEDSPWQHLLNAVHEDIVMEEASSSDEV